MRVSGSRHPSFSVGAVGFSVALMMATASGGGCTLFVESELVDKPAEGGGGQGGGDASTAEQSSAASSSGSGRGTGTGTGTGGTMCKDDTVDCDGLLWNGCEAMLLTDAENCGACKKICQLGTKCDDGECG